MVNVVTMGEGKKEKKKKNARGSVTDEEKQTNATSMEVIYHISYML